MGDMQVPQRTKRATISAIVTRADGTVEDLGVVSFYEANPLKRAWLKLKQRRGERIDETEVFSGDSGDDGGS